MLPIITFLVSLFLAFLGGTLLFSNTVINGLISAIINVGLDTLRAQFIAALIMAAGTAFISATLGRHKGGALVGAGVVFWVGYLLGFLRLELQPVYDPGGHLEPLNSGALAHTALTMTALALLCAFIGASVGVSCAEVLLDPLYQLVHLAWWRFVRQPESATAGKKAATIPAASSQAKRVTRTITAWLSAGMMIVLLVLASDSSNLFVFSPDVGLHESPDVSTGKGGLAHGTIVQDSVVSWALSGLSTRYWGWALDLMRRGPQAPPGVIELLLVRAIERFRECGAQVISLGMVAMADTRQEMTAHQRQVASFVSDHLHLLETHCSLFHFKQKFHPRWESRYVVVGTTLSLPKVALAILRIHQS